MIGIHFNKATIERFLDSMKTGNAFECPDPKGWTVDGLLCLAGVCHAMAFSNRPILGGHSRDWDKMPIEQREAAEDNLYSDVSGAIEFYGNLAMLVEDGTYDDRLESHGEAMLSGGETRTVKPIAGFKDYSKRE